MYTGINERFQLSSEQTMPHPNLNIISRFFDAYSRRNMDELRQILAADIRWVSFGDPLHNGVSHGFDEVIAFFDRMGAIMSKSNGQVEKLIESADDNYVIECLRVQANGEGENNLDHLVCVLWKIEDSRIVEGRHFFSDSTAADTVIGYISAFQ